jgi:hypothetical protein
MKTPSTSIIVKSLKACLLSLGMCGILASTSCIGIGPLQQPRVSKPLTTDMNELHWRMYFEDQFDAYGASAAPDAGAPNVAWTAYMAEKNSFAIRENNRLLKKQMRIQKNRDKKLRD